MKGQPEASTMSGDAGSRMGRYRYVVVAVIWVAFLFWAFDRTAISLLLADHGFLKDMGLEGSPGRQGLLMTFLLLPYALSNIFCGQFADRWGPRRVLTVMTGLWSVAAIWMGAHKLLCHDAGRTGDAGHRRGALVPGCEPVCPLLVPALGTGRRQCHMDQRAARRDDLCRASIDADHRFVGVALRLFPAGCPRPYSGPPGCLVSDRRRAGADGQESG